jgi:hypothetical protein
MCQDICTFCMVWEKVNICLCPHHPVVPANANPHPRPQDLEEVGIKRFLFPTAWHPA